MAKSADPVGPDTAIRVVHTIGFIKWATLAIIALGVLGATALGLAGDNGFKSAVSLFAMARPPR